MPEANFAAVMEHVFAREGGYVDHPADPGGATNMGITQATLAAWRGRAVTKAEVRALTREEASDIYYQRYWRAAGCHQMPPGFDLVLMDAAVNSGPVRGVRWLQEGLGVATDGIVGPITVEAAWKAGPDELRKAIDAREKFLRGLSTWSKFGRGWTRRLDEVRAAAAEMLLVHLLDAPAEPEAEAAEEAEEVEPGDRAYQLLTGAADLFHQAADMMNRAAEILKED